LAAFNFTAGKSGNMPKRRDIPGGISPDDPNGDRFKRFSLKAWADSHGLVADALGGRASLADFVDGCVRTFAQGAEMHIAFKDSTPILGQCKELDVLAKKCIQKVRKSLLAESERLGESDMKALVDDFSLRVNEIAARSKQRLYEEELARCGPPEKEQRSEGGDSLARSNIPAPEVKRPSGDDAPPEKLQSAEPPMAEAQNPVVPASQTMPLSGGPVSIGMVTPNMGHQGQTITSVAVVGQFTTFVNGTTVASFGAGITVNSATVSDATHATMNITIAGDATVGARDVTLTTNSENATLPGGFSVADSRSLADEGWTRIRHADWREDAAYARKCPPSLRPAKAARLDAMAILRREAAEAVQRAKPQTAEGLEQCLRPLFLKYAQNVFDCMAEAKLTRVHGRRPRGYTQWLRSKCLPAVMDDVCRPIFGQFPITVRYIAEIIGDVHWPEEAIRTRQVLWRTIADEVIPGSRTQSLENHLSITLSEERIPHWEARAAEPQSGIAEDPVTLPREVAAPPLQMSCGPEVKLSRRKPDIQSSRERLELLNILARELAILKGDLKGYNTVEGLKQKHPTFVLWAHIEAAELKELVDGEAFAPKAYAGNLVLRKFGLTSPETLKKDRQKLRKAQSAKQSH
jgi:hypothetical protein